jgi:hypothetical protein
VYKHIRIGKEGSKSVSQSDYITLIVMQDALTIVRQVIEARDAVEVVQEAAREGQVSVRRGGRKRAQRRRRKNSRRRTVVSRPKYAGSPPRAPTDETKIKHETKIKQAGEKTHNPGPSSTRTLRRLSTPRTCRSDLGAYVIVLAFDRIRGDEIKQRTTTP